jgi:DNA transformation protein
LSDAVAKLPSLGPVTAMRLAEVGITTPAALRKIGAVAAYKKLRFRFGRDVTLNALYGLEAAVRNIDWRLIDQAEKARLRHEAGVD